MDNADMRSCASRESLPVRYMRVVSIKASSFQAKGRFSAPEQFQIDAAKLCKQRGDFLIIFYALGNFILIRFRDRIKLGFPIVIRGEVQAFVAFASGTSAVGLAAFNGSGDQGGSYDMAGSSIMSRSS